MKKNQQSVLDTFISFLPNLKNKLTKDTNYVDEDAAKTLFSVWRTAANKINDKTYKRPDNISLADIQNMQKENLIRHIGSNIEITEKGSKVLKIMILGDERSSFEDNDIIIDYNKALANMKNVKTSKKNVK